MDQLTEATHRQGTTGGNLGAILVELGHLTEAQLQQVLRARQQVVAKAKAKQAAEAAVPAPEAGVATASPSPAAQPPPASDSLFGDDPPQESVPPAAAPPQQSDPKITPAQAEAPPQPEPAAAPSPSVELRPAAAPPTATSATAPSNPADAEPLIALLRQGVEAGASDIHVHSRTPLRLRLHGRFTVAGTEPMAPEAAEKMLLASLTDREREQFLEQGELDYAYSVPGLGRFRANIFRQQRGTDGVFRHIPAEAPSLDGLGLPSTLAKFTNYHQGLVLITGPANCGKSSTMAAMVDIINTERKDHILTIEDPVEYLHPSKRCIVNQRNVGPNTSSFARALKGALREDPDVIVIGELRDLETVSLALSAAETGHLVLGTLHTNSTIRTLNRLVGVFPAEQQDQIRNMVSESLRAVISQRLVPTADGAGRAPALEVLVNNKAIGNLIRENKTFQIPSILQTGSTQGMCLLDQSLGELINDGTITREEAMRHAEDPRKLPGA